MLGILEQLVFNGIDQRQPRRLDDVLADADGAPDIGAVARLDDDADAGGGAGPSSGMPPSDKALSFAESTAESKGVPLPDAARTSAKACSEFINAHKGGGGAGKGPAKKGGTKSAAKSGSKRR